MFKGFYNLTSAMLTQGRNLNVISNNMANVSTAGFKVDKFTYSTYQEEVWSRAGNKVKNYEQIGTMSFITAPSVLYTDYSQSSFDDTDLPLDFCIEGEGWFALETPDGGRAYTRAGSFSLDNEGYLWLSDLGYVLNSNEERIQLVTDQITADSLGQLFTSTGGYLGQIGVWAFEDNETLEKNDYALFVTEEEPTINNVNVKIHQGMVERSNADMADQMVDMITSERAYQSAAEVIKIYDDLIDKATTDVGRV